MAEETVYLIAAPLQGDEELAEQLGGERDSQRPATRLTDGSPPLRAFPRSISVQGFRGIAPARRWN